MIFDPLYLLIVGVGLVLGFLASAKVKSTAAHYSRIGTRRGYDPSSQLLPPRAGDPAASKTLPHRRYSKDVGAVLADVTGATASYTLRGDEIYVRARVISSKAKVNGSVADEFETAWTQPVVGAVK